jgi:hypothetical protein
MPELEARIREWKQSLSVALGGAQEIVDELESHLREEIHQQIQAGQPPETALTIAQAKLGRPRDLAAEFARATPTEVWLPIWVCLGPTIMLFVFLAWAFLLPKLLANGQELLVAHVALLLAGHLLAWYAGLLGICYVACWVVRPIRLGQRRLLGRTLLLANGGAAILLLSGMLLGMVWAKEHLGPVWNNDPREIGTALLIPWFAMIAGLGWTAPRKQHLCVLLSILGISVDVGGWLGPSLCPLVHAYGVVNGAFLFWLTCGTVLPLAVALVGLLPGGCLRLKAG